jgi:hypothetical protein
LIEEETRLGRRPDTMQRERLHRDPGAQIAPWLSYTDLEPVAASAEDVAARLGVTVEQVHGCGVEPYLAADGRPLLSIRLVGMALGLRPDRRDRQRVRERARSARRRAARREDEEG